jgi:hypothetical protein
LIIECAENIRIILFSSDEEENYSIHAELSSDYCSPDRKSKFRQDEEKVENLEQLQEEIFDTLNDNSNSNSDKSKKHEQKIQKDCFTKLISKCTIILKNSQFK